MTYLLIIFVIALALAPLTHFLPSKRQREIARMREYAAVHGLFVEFRGLPGAATQRVARRNSEGQETIYYGKRLPPGSRKSDREKLSWLRVDGAWRGLERRLNVPAVLARFPNEVLAASVDENSCGVYWCEAGGVEIVEQVRLVLEQWAGDLRD